jgi:RIO kinase 1
MTVKELFDFVTDPTVSEDNMDDYLGKMMEITSTRSNLTGLEVEDEIFKKSFIPFTMNDVVDFERDFRRVKQGENLIYTTLHGLKEDLSKPRLVPELLENGQVEDKEKQCEVKNEMLESLKKDKKEDEKDLDSEDDSEEDDSESDEDDSEDDDDEESGEEDENNNNQDPAKLAKIALHYRPRDESPESKKVTESHFYSFYSLFKAHFYKLLKKA